MVETVFDIFGDESVSSNAIIYGVVAIHSDSIKSWEDKLAALKLKYGVPVNSELHCSILFHGSKREKSTYSHLSEKETYSFGKELAYIMGNPEIGCVIAYADRREFPEIFKGGQMTSKDGTISDRQSPDIIIDEKSLIAFCGNAALIPFVQSPGLDKIRFWADPDNTKINWLGKKSKALNALNMFVGHEEKTQRIQPEQIEGENPALLQLADFLAYVSSRTLSIANTRGKEEFDTMYRMLNSEIIRYTKAPDGVFAINVPDNIVGRIKKREWPP